MRQNKGTVWKPNKTVPSSTTSPGQDRSLFGLLGRYSSGSGPRCEMHLHPSGVMERPIGAALPSLSSFRRSSSHSALRRDRLVVRSPATPVSLTEIRHDPFWYRGLATQSQHRLAIVEQHFKRLAQRRELRPRIERGVVSWIVRRQPKLASSRTS